MNVLEKHFEVLRQTNLIRVEQQNTLDDLLQKVQDYRTKLQVTEKAIEDVHADIRNYIAKETGGVAYDKHTDLCTDHGVLLHQRGAW